MAATTTPPTAPAPLEEEETAEELSLAECAASMDTKAKREAISKGFFPNTGYNYDRCVAGATLGFDAEWKRLMMKEIPASSTNVLELASGTAIVSKRILEKCGVETPLTCVDITDDYVDVAMKKLHDLEEKESAKRTKKNLPPVKLDVKYIIKNAEDIAVEDLQDRAPFDCVVSSYIPKYVDADRVLDGIEPHLASGCKLVLHDFDVPYGPFKPIWYMHMDLWASLGPKFYGKEWAACFEANLKDLIVKSQWTDKWSAALSARGWHDVKVHRITLGGASLITATRA